MRRDPPEKVKSHLRHEVNFGCPVEECGIPFLTWHHFDPPWSEREHHNPEGMIALCETHHTMANAIIFSKDQLREWKANPNPRDFIREKFLWFLDRCLIRLGGCYAPNWCAVEFGGEQVLGVSGENSDHNTIDAVLRDADGNVLLRFDKNMFSVELSSIHDISISVSSNRVKVWSAPREIGFECHYSVKALPDIENLIVRDTPPVPVWASSDPPEPITDVEAFYQELAGIDDFREIAAIGMRRSDAAGTGVRWYVARMLRADGTIPVFDFVRCRFPAGRRSLALGGGSMKFKGESVRLNATFCVGNRFRF